MNKFGLVVLLFVVMISSVVIGIVLVFNPELSPLTGGFAGNQYLNSPPAADIRLTTIDGEPFRLSDYKGKVIAISFIYSHCPDICPAITSGFAELEDILEREGLLDDVVLVLVAVDYPGGYVAAVSGDTLYYINYTGDVEWTASLSGVEPKAVEMSQDGGVIVVWGGDKLLIYDRFGRLASSYSYGVEISDVFVSGAGSHIFVAVGERLYRYYTSVLENELTVRQVWNIGFDSQIVGVSALTNGTYSFVIDEAGDIYRVTRDGEIEESIAIGEGGILMGDVSSNGITATLVYETDVYIVNVVDNRLIKIDLNSSDILDLDVSQTGRYVAFALGERAIVYTGNGSKYLELNISALSVSISADDQYLSISTGEEVIRYNLYSNSTDWASEVRDVVSVDVAMERDSPKRLKEWGALYGTENVIFLYGSYRNLNQVWAKYGIAVFYADVDPPELSYLVAHTGVLYIIDKNFNVRIFFIGAPPQWSPADAANDIRILVREN